MTIYCTNPTKGGFRFRFISILRLWMTAANLSGAKYSHLLRLLNQWISCVVRIRNTESGIRGNQTSKEPSLPVGREGIKDTGSKVTRNRIPWSFVELTGEKTVFQIPGSVIDNQKLIDAKGRASCIANPRQWANFSVVKHDRLEGRLNIWTSRVEWVEGNMQGARGGNGGIQCGCRGA